METVHIETMRKTLNDITLMHFDQLWELFDKKLLDAGGSMFLINPFREFFPKSFADRMSPESAKTRLHQNLARWGEIEQAVHEIEVTEEHQFEDGSKFQLTQFKDSDVRWAREFIFTAFYNLCCLAANKQTIEELILISMSDPNSVPMSTTSRTAFLRLIDFSNSFLLSEWAQDLIHRAVSNSDDKFFTGLSLSIKKNSAKAKFPVAKSWLGTILLWYLGGKNLKRREFMDILLDRKIISLYLDLPTFNAMLWELHLHK